MGALAHYDVCPKVTRVCPDCGQTHSPNDKETCIINLKKLLKQKDDLIDQQIKSKNQEFFQLQMFKHKEMTNMVAKKDQEMKQIVDSKNQEFSFLAESMNQRIDQCETTIKEKDKRIKELES